MNRVAVTGLGIVSALGLSASEVWNKLKQGESGIAPLPDRKPLNRKGLCHAGR